MNLIYKFLNNRIAVTSTFLAITVLILYMTLMPSNRIGSFAIYEYDKLGHFMVFFVWSLSFGLLINSFKKSYVNLYLVFFTGSLFGICIELLQGWMRSEERRVGREGRDLGGSEPLYIRVHN